MSVDADISTSLDLLGKAVTDLQSGIEVGNNGITGTLKFVDDYTGFSGDPSLQTGNFLVLHVDVPDVEDVTYTVTLTNTVVLDSDQIVVLRISDPLTQTMVVTASKEGYPDVVRTYSLQGLTCETE